MLIAISGGIGSGKSVVSRMLDSMGYHVYDCDSQARQLIDGSQEIKTTICMSLGDECIDADGNLDRKAVSDIVFSDREKLEMLNKITHAAVRNDIRRWHSEAHDAMLFVETAILYQSEIDRMVEAVIEVEAPLDIRINRIMNRNGYDYNEAMNRINSQKHNVGNLHPRIYNLVNDDRHALLPQLQDILAKLRSDKEAIRRDCR